MGKKIIAVNAGPRKGWNTDPQQVLTRFVGPTEIFVSGDTLQIKDYGKTDWPWTLFNPEAKQLRHETVFPEHRRQVFALGAKLGS